MLRLGYSPAMNKQAEKLFENALWNSRLALIPAVIASLVGALVLILIGALDVALVVKHGVDAARGLVSIKSLHIEALGLIITAVDFFLIATVLLIFGLGLYELFISRIDAAENDSRASSILTVHSLDDLKERLAKVLVMVLVVTFFKHAIDLKMSGGVKDLLLFGLGILFVSAALFLLNRPGHDKSE